MFGSSKFERKYKKKKIQKKIIQRKNKKKEKVEKNKKNRLKIDKLFFIIISNSFYLF